MRRKIQNAFIRVSSTNHTADGDTVTYTSADIENTLNDWLTSATFTYYFIEHSADDEISQTHWHILLRFPSPTQFDTIKNRFPFGDIEPARNSKNCIQYMVHLNDQSKKQYLWDDIRTNDKNTDWYKVQSNSTSEVLLQGIMEKIMSGEIRQYEQVEKIPPELWAKYKVRITNWFEYYTKRVASDSNRKIDTIYFSGSTCTGKTTVAKMYCVLNGWSYYVSSASNDVMQGYEGQDVLILDDFRGDMEQKGSVRPFNLPDFLKMTDQNTRTSIKSRYYNKDFIGRLIIITSVRPIYDMYYNLAIEDKHQLFRRVVRQLQFTKEKIYEYEYSRECKKYLPVSIMPNPAHSHYSNVESSSGGFNFASSFGLTTVPCDLPAVQEVDHTGSSSCLPSLSEALEKRQLTNNLSQCQFVGGN